MPKCAGTSMKRVFKRVYGDNFKVDYSSYCTIPQKHRFAKILADSSQDDAQALQSGMIYGHFYPIKYVNVESRSSIKRSLVTFLRDPLERLVSHYSYWKGLKNGSVHFLYKQMVAEDWSFAKFALSMEMRNFYSQYFFQVPIDSFDFIGVHENLDNDWRKLCDFLGIGCHELPRKNKSNSSSILSDLSSDLCSEIRDFHSEDYFLYNYAVNNSIG